MILSPNDSVFHWFRRTTEASWLNGFQRRGREWGHRVFPLLGVMRQAVGLRKSIISGGPKALPWAGMIQAFGLEGRAQEGIVRLVARNQCGRACDAKGVVHISPGQRPGFAAQRNIPER
jgi:hypothetical protein